jgi:hypothetical protein
MDRELGRMLLLILSVAIVAVVSTLLMSHWDMVQDLVDSFMAKRILKM